MKMRTAPVWAAVEMKSNADGLTARQRRGQHGTWPFVIVDMGPR